MEAIFLPPHTHTHAHSEMLQEISSAPIGLGHICMVLHPPWGIPLNFSLGLLENDVLKMPTFSAHFLIPSHTPICSWPLLTQEMGNLLGEGGDGVEGGEEGGRDR